MKFSAENIKGSLTPSQINIKSHTKGIFTSVPITWYIMSSFQQKFTRSGKRQNKTKLKQYEETKQASEQDSDMAEGLNRNFQNWNAKRKKNEQDIIEYLKARDN